MPSKGANRNTSGARFTSYPANRAAPCRSAPRTFLAIKALMAKAQRAVGRAARDAAIERGRALSRRAGARAEAQNRKRQSAVRLIRFGGDGGEGRKREARCKKETATAFHDQPVSGDKRRPEAPPLVARELEIPEAVITRLCQRSCKISLR